MPGILFAIGCRFLVTSCRVKGIHPALLPDIIGHLRAAVATPLRSRPSLWLDHFRTAALHRRPAALCLLFNVFGAYFLFAGAHQLARHYTHVPLPTSPISRSP